MDAFGMLYSQAATALDIKGSDYFSPTKWEDWINIPIESEDEYIQTINRRIKIPKVIILSKYDKIPKKRPKFSQKNVWIRDKFTCQYTGKKLKPGEGNIDHVIPKSRGGLSAWENCVLACRQINAKKANSTPDEVGLRLINTPKPPKELPIFYYIRNKHRIKEWNFFLAEVQN